MNQTGRGLPEAEEGLPGPGLSICVWASLPCPSLAGRRRWWGGPRGSSPRPGSHSCPPWVGPLGLISCPLPAQSFWCLALANLPQLRTCPEQSCVQGCARPCVGLSAKHSWAGRSPPGLPCAPGASGGPGPSDGTSRHGYERTHFSSQPLSCELEERRDRGFTCRAECAGVRGSPCNAPTHGRHGQHPCQRALLQPQKRDPPTNPGLPQVAWAVAFLGSRRTGSDGEHSLITTRNSSGLLSSSVPPAGRANSGLWAVSTRCPVAPRGVCRHTCHHPSLTRGGSLPVPES